jgi:anti-anti-sigma factor
LALPTPFDLHTSVRNGLAVVAVVGELDCATAPGLSRVLGEMSEPGRVILVDLSGTEFMDCAGLAPLVAACEHQRELGGDLILDAPTSAVSRVIECTHLDGMMTVVSARQPALVERLVQLPPVRLVTDGEPLRAVAAIDDQLSDGGGPGAAREG